MEYPVSNRMSRIRGSAIREIFKYAADPSVISLAGGNPAPELFPNRELAEIAADLLRNQPVLSLQYGITEGYLPLREAVRDRLLRKEGIGGAEDDLIITSGGQQGIELATKILVNEGDTVVVEQPSFIGALNAFRSYGANLVSVPVEPDGLDPDALDRVLLQSRNVRFLYTIPTFQNPTGVTMSEEKRRRVYEVARKHNILILEDNPYGELSFDGSRRKTLKSMDADGRVLYSGSFSKILAPGLRVGYLCADRALIRRIVVAKQVSDVHTPMLPQLLAYGYMTRCDPDALISEMRATYAHKCAVMLSAMEREFPREITYTRPDGGLFIWCDLGHGIDTLPLAREALAEKVVFVPGSTFQVDPDAPCSSLRLNYSTVSDERINEGIRRLGTVFCKALRDCGR